MQKLSFFLLAVVLISCKPIAVSVDIEQNPTKRPKNVILLVGDGMGISQITATMYQNNNKTQLERCPVVGLHKSLIANDFGVLPSSGATAFAAGINANNYFSTYSVDTLTQLTIMEQAKEQGLAVGIVTASSLTGATSAAFVSHLAYKQPPETIATFFLANQLDYFVGGGKQYFEQREDKRNITDEIRAKGCQITDFSVLSFEQLTINPNQCFGYFTANDVPSSKMEGRNYFIPAVIKGMNLLKQRAAKKGFLFVIENEQIGWAGKTNDTNYMLQEALEFDETIGKVLDWAAQNKETLVIITANHEAGGYAISPIATMDSIKSNFTSNYYTATMVPVFAFGPGSELFSGVYDNTAIYHKIRTALAFE